MKNAPRSFLTPVQGRASAGRRHQSAVSGSEEADDRHKHRRAPAGNQGHRASPVESLSHFHHVFNGRDLSMVEQSCETAPEVARDNPLGGISRGWDENEEL